MELVKIRLEQSEYSGLVRLSEKELRSVADEIRHIVRKELSRKGLLTENKSRVLVEA